jgi:predicted PurR-regulated permease PerM
MIKFPAYFKITQILLGLLLFFYILYIGQEILKPLFFAFILAILLNPVAGFLQRLGVGRVLSILISVLLLCILIGGILFFIGSQVTMFREALPELKRKFFIMSERVLEWAANTFKIPRERILEWLNEQKAAGLNDAGGMVGNTLVTISGILVTFLLVPVYIFLFLFYKPLLLDFIGRVFSTEKHRTLAEILGSTRTVIQSYLVGLMLEMAIMTILYTSALLIIGVQYAVVLAAIGALLNLIPYIGGLISVIIAMLMALITGTITQALFVLGSFVLVQIIDNNFLVPMVVASKVKVNALVSIVVVLIWGALWGVAGMFLSIPITAIIKVIFDKVKGLKPYGFLLGDSMPPIGKKVFRISALHWHESEAKRKAQEPPL